jgi:hypothetical protein
MKSAGVFFPAQIVMIPPMMCGVDPAECYDLVTLLRVNPVMLEHGVPADRPAAAVGVVAVGHGQAVAVAVGQALERAVAGDVPGIESNAQAVTVPAQIVAAEALGRAAGGPSAVRPGDHPGWRPAGLPLSGSVAGRMPALRVLRAAGGAVAVHRSVGRGRKPRHEAAAGGAGRDAGPPGAGRRGGEDCYLVWHRRGYGRSRNPVSICVDPIRDLYVNA